MNQAPQITPVAPPQETPLVLVPSQPKSKLPRIIFFICFTLVICVIVLLSILHTFHMHKSYNGAAKISVESKLPQNQSTVLIAHRANVLDQRHIDTSGTVSAGFLDMSLLKKMSGRNTLGVNNVYADESSLHPVFFYLDNTGTQIRLLDLATGKTTTLFNLHAFPTIVFHNGTKIRKFSYINGTKQIGMEITERLDTYPDTDATIQQNLWKFKTSIQVYDIASNTLQEMVSTTGGGGSIANWKGFRVSPDEKYLSAIYDNMEPVDPFADVPHAVTATSSGNLTVTKPNNTTYFFYNLQTKQLSKYKTDFNILTVSSVTWQADSSSLLIGSGFNYATFVQITPDGKLNYLVNKPADINHFLKVQYIPELKKVFYIGSKTTIDTQSQLGYYDMMSDSFSTVNTQASQSGSLNFIYDYQGGLVYDTFQDISTSNQGSIINQALNYFRPDTNQTTQIIPKSLSIISFDGDYSHLLVSDRIDNTNSRISDLNTKTGELQYLRDAPVTSSVFSDNQ